MLMASGYQCINKNGVHYSKNRKKEKWSALPSPLSFPSSIPASSYVFSIRLRLLGVCSLLHTRGNHLRISRKGDSWQLQRVIKLTYYFLQHLDRVCTCKTNRKKLANTVFLLLHRYPLLQQGGL